MLLGDSGYPCKNYLLTPYLDPTEPHEINYNKAHCQTRVRIEQTFGIVKNRFPCLKYLRVTPERAVTIISACFVLHDIARLRNDMRFDNMEFEADENDHEVQGDHRDDGTGNAFRDHIARAYFS